jgi:hypothetical protein
MKLKLFGGFASCIRGLRWQSIENEMALVRLTFIEIFELWWAGGDKDVRCR